MESLAESYLAARAATWAQGAERVLDDAVKTLHQGGDHRAAASLLGVLNALRGHEPALNVLDEPVPGLYALVRLAGRERRDPYGMLPGEHARLVFPDRTSVSGVWCYDEPTDEWPVGRAYIVRDDNGEDYDVGGGGMQIQPVWLDLAQRDKPDALARAVTIIASAWAGNRALRGAEHDELIKHEHIDYDQPVDPTYQRRERRRRCECGELAFLRVVAWAPSPNTEVMQEETFETTSWARPAEYAEETVCSPECAEAWVTAYRQGAADLLSDSIALELRFNLEPWVYEPAFDELPAVLALAREQAAGAAEYVKRAAAGWLEGERDAAAADLKTARTAATVALARIAELEPVERGPRVLREGDAEPTTVMTVTTAAGGEFVNDPVHKFWLPNWQSDLGPILWPDLLTLGPLTAQQQPELFPTDGGTHPRDVPVDVWHRMAAPLVAKILDDPHRYEVVDGGAIVYDRQTNQHIDGATGRHAQKTTS